MSDFNYKADLLDAVQRSDTARILQYAERVEDLEGKEEDPVGHELRVQQTVQAYQDKIAYADAERRFRYRFRDVEDDQRRWDWCVQQHPQLKMQYPHLTDDQLFDIIGNASRNIPTGSAQDGYEYNVARQQERARMGLAPGTEIIETDSESDAEALAEREADGVEQRQTIAQMKRARAPHNPGATFDWSQGDT